MQNTLCSAVVLCLSAGFATAQTTHFNPATGHYYTLTAELPTVFAARSQAVAWGGYLVAINDAAEQSWLQSTFFGNGTPAWIGLSDELQENVWLWDSGESFAYSNWCMGQPNNANTGEDHVAIDLSAGGCWGDFASSAPVNGPFAGIVEALAPPPWQPQPPAPFNMQQASWTGAITTLFPPLVILPSSSIDVAYDITHDLYGVVVGKTQPGNDTVSVVRHHSDGTPFGNPVLINSVTGSLGGVTIANSRQTGRFVIGWHEDNSVKAMLMFATHAAPAPTVLTVASNIPTGVSGLGEPDMASDPSGQDDEVVIVWADGNGIQAADLRTNSTIQAWSYLTVTSDPFAKAPKISKSLDSQTGLYRYCIVWSNQFDVYAALIDPNMASFGSPILVSSSALLDDFNPDVAGDGGDFLVTWQRDEVSGSASDIVCCRLTVVAGAQLTVAGPEVSVATQPFVHERSPAIAWLGPKYMITYQTATSATIGWCTSPGPTPIFTGTRYENSVAVRHASDGTACGPSYIVNSSLTSINQPLPPVVAAERSGAQGAGYGGLIVWQESCFEYFAPTEFETFRTYGAFHSALGGGPIVNLGGGCGLGGALTVSGPAALGNDEFEIVLNGADPNGLLAVLVAGAGPGVPCGPCELTVPTVGSLVLGLANGGLTAGVTLPCSPSFVGLQVVWQAAVLPSTGPCPILSNFAISNRLQTTLAW